MGFLERLFSSGKPASGSMAKERLQLVLVHDRSNLTPEQVQAMKDEILAVIAKYVEFEKDKVSVKLESENRESILMAEIPIVPASTRRRHTAAAGPDDA